ncbi:hypothetical protein KAW38_00890 [Candidatus Micrarchaeota archaeon]|nr:hypothetical protein [Candidatus Micrarchaeota archaeon]
MRRFLTFLMGLMVLVNLSSALVVVNSQDGLDVSSAAFYAILTEEKLVFFAPGSSGIAELVLIGEGKEVYYIESSDNAVYVGFKGSMEQKGNTVEQYSSEDPLSTNRYLAEKSGAENFILADPAYGTTIVSTMPYGKLTNSFLLFVTEANAGQVADFLKGKGEILVYGYVDDAVLESLDENNINYDRIYNEDIYEDNLALVDKYFEINPDKKQVVFAGGEYLEDSIITGEDPIILASEVLPTAVENYIKEKAREGQITVGVIIDNRYTAALGSIMRKINEEAGNKIFSLFLKFGQTLPGVNQGVNPLVTFPLPHVILNLVVKNMEYNTATKTLDITYENKGNVPIYYKSSMNLFLDGESFKSVGDEDAETIGKGGITGVSYSLEVEEGELTTNITVLYGSSKNSFEKGFIQDWNIGRIDYIDISELSMSEAVYNPETDELSIRFTNSGEESVYFKVSSAYLIEGISTAVESEGQYDLEPNSARVVKLTSLLVPKDKLEEVEMKATANYGGREGFLVKTAETDVEIKQPEMDLTILWIVLAVILVLVVAYFLFSGKEKNRSEKR